jgi:hypothetical protein
VKPRLVISRPCGWKRLAANSKRPSRRSKKWPTFAALEAQRSFVAHFPEESARHLEDIGSPSRTDVNLLAAATCLKRSAILSIKRPKSDRKSSK